MWILPFSSKDRRTLGNQKALSKAADGNRSTVVLKFVQCHSFLLHRNAEGSYYILFIVFGIILFPNGAGYGYCISFTCDSFQSISKWKL